MKPTKQAAIDELREVAAKLLAQAERIERLIPDDIPGILWGTADYIRLVIPYDPALFAVVRRKLGHDWKRVHGWEYREDGDRYIRYSHKAAGVELVVSLDPTLPGSTYRRVRIRTVETPIYRAVREE